MKIFSRLVMTAAILLPTSAMAANLPEPMAIVAPAAETPASGALFSAEQSKAIEEMIHQYIMSHPQVVIDSLQKAQEEEQNRQAKAAEEAVKMNKDQLDKDPQAIIGGNPDGDVTVVEFFDYQCGYCKAAQKMVEQLLSEDKNVRFIYKEFPILGSNSLKAAQAVLASRTQGKYVEFHNALMELSDHPDDKAIFSTAAKVGLDVEKLRKDMQDPAVQKIIDDTAALARAMQIRGTPAFIIGDQLVPGALSLDDMKAQIAKQREAAKK